MILPLSSEEPKCVPVCRGGARTAARGIRVARWCAILLLPLWFGGEGLWAGFTADDMMNLYGYWSRPLVSLIQANVLPFTPYYRPAGGVFYLVMFEAAGLDPLPYRIACYALLVGNIALLFRLAREVSGSREIAFLAAMLAAHHRGYIDFYYNTGTVYDLLCFGFYVAALTVYVSARRTEDALGWRATAAVTALFACALNSKEIAVTLPAAILAWEWINRRRPPEALLPWTALALLYAHSKLSAASIFNDVGGYQLSVTAERYWGNTGAFLEMLFVVERGTLGPAAVVAIYGGMAGIGWLLRSRAMLWSAAFAILAPLPVTFIPLRGIFAWYAAMTGWWIWTASAAVLIGQRVSGRMGIWSAAPRLALFAAAWAGLFAFHEAHRWEPGPPSPVSAAIGELRGLALDVRPDSRILFLEDRFNTDEWTPLFVARLLYGAPHLAVDRVKTMGGATPSCAKIAGYEVLLRDDGSRIVRVPRAELCP